MEKKAGILISVCLHESVTHSITHSFIKPMLSYKTLPLTTWRNQRIRLRFCSNFTSLPFVRGEPSNTTALYSTSSWLPSSRALGRRPHCNVLPSMLTASVAWDVGHGNSQISPPAFSFFFDSSPFPPGTITFSAPRAQPSRPRSPFSSLLTSLAHPHGFN